MSDRTAYDAIVDRAKNHKVIVVILLISGIVIGVGSFTQAVQNISNAFYFWSRSNGVSSKSDPGSVRQEGLSCRYVFVTPLGRLRSSVLRLDLYSSDITATADKGTILILKGYEVGEYSVEMKTERIKGPTYLALGSKAFPVRRYYKGVLSIKDAPNYLLTVSSDADSQDIGFKEMSSMDTLRYLNKYELKLPDCSRAPIGVSKLDP